MTMIVAKLRGARERVRRTKGKCEGRKSYAEAKPELVALAKQLKRHCDGSRWRKSAQSWACGVFCER
jgi:hypothetical protein